jgi:hypothetical protein
MQPKAPVPEPPPVAANALGSLADLQRAMADAIALGFIDNNKSSTGRKPRRTGYWVAERLCVPGAWTKRHERSLKIAYLAGFDYATSVGRGVSRKPRRLL